MTAHIEPLRPHDLGPRLAFTWSTTNPLLGAAPGTSAELPFRELPGNASRRAVARLSGLRLSRRSQHALT